MTGGSELIDIHSRLPSPGPPQRSLSIGSYVKSFECVELITQERSTYTKGLCDDKADKEYR